MALLGHLDWCLGDPACARMAAEGNTRRAEGFQVDQAARMAPQAGDEVQEPFGELTGAF